MDFGGIVGVDVRREVGGVGFRRMLGEAARCIAAQRETLATDIDAAAAARKVARLRFVDVDEAVGRTERFREAVGPHLGTYDFVRGVAANEDQIVAAVCHRDANKPMRFIRRAVGCAGVGPLLLTAALDQVELPGRNAKLQQAVADIGAACLTEAEIVIRRTGSIRETLDIHIHAGVDQEGRERLNGLVLRRLI